ncbi:MAG: ABC transporter ATP-binding protein [Patescibacteria group bacterium]|nr:ABC transporter ATP-binding protein [Patescibacteria group bacterium]
MENQTESNYIKPIAIVVRGLVKHFGGVYAVDGLSITIEKGKVTGIVGPNGSGKTTLINALSGILPIDDGKVSFDGVWLSKVKSYEVSSYGITRTFQDVRLFNQMLVLDNILIVLTERNVFGSLFEKHSDFHLKRAEEILRRVNLWEKRHELAKNLSYGQRKLLEIARALAMNAEIYLFDEPFAGIFREMAKIIAAIVNELRVQGKTVILIEHDMNLIRELCDHVFVLDSGKLLAEGKPEEVLKKKEVVEAYLGE